MTHARYLTGGVHFLETATLEGNLTDAPRGAVASTPALQACVPLPQKCSWWPMATGTSFPAECTMGERVPSPAPAVYSREKREKLVRGARASAHLSQRSAEATHEATHADGLRNVSYQKGITSGGGCEHAGSVADAGPLGPQTRAPPEAAPRTLHPPPGLLRGLQGPQPVGVTGRSSTEHAGSRPRGPRASAAGRRQPHSRSPREENPHAHGEVRSLASVTQQT